MSETDRIEVTRRIHASPADVFAVLCDPQGHVAIDASGMLQSADGEVVTAAGDQFVVHMDRESLGDLDMGRYDVEVTIRTFEQDRQIDWTIIGTVRPPIGHVYGYRLAPDGDATLVTSYYDWSEINDEWRAKGIFPIISEANLKGTLGILERAVVRGYVRVSRRA